MRKALGDKALMKAEEVMRILFSLALMVVAACGKNQPDVAPVPETGPPEVIECEHAIKASSVPFEYSWLREHFPGHTVEMQGLVQGTEGKAYDVLTFTTAEGKRGSVCFDISSFFGRS